jgi:hypothetical protein
MVTTGRSPISTASAVKAAASIGLAKVRRAGRSGVAADRSPCTS